MIGGETQLTIAINFVSSKENDEERVIHSNRMILQNLWFMTI